MKSVLIYSNLISEGKKTV